MRAGAHDERCLVIRSRDGVRRGLPGSGGHVAASVYVIARPPAGAVCCRCDEPIDEAVAVNVPGLRARGWSHRTCLPDWLLP